MGDAKKYVQAIVILLGHNENKLPNSFLYLPVNFNYLPVRLNGFSVSLLEAYYSFTTLI